METDGQALMRPEHEVWTADGEARIRIGDACIALRRWDDGTVTAALRELTQGRVRVVRKTGPVSALSALLLHPAVLLVAEQVRLDDVQDLTNRLRPLAPWHRTGVAA